MKVERIEGRPHKLTLIGYDNPRDLVKQAARGAKATGEQRDDTGWQGGTPEYFERGMRGGVLDFVSAAKNSVRHFSNVALRDYALDYEYNVKDGVLDYEAMELGIPTCMYGPTLVETERAPIDVYVDPYVLRSVKATTIQKRGIGLLALIQVLAMYRPVNAFILKGNHHGPAKADTIQTLQIPTAPMDLARASFILCSPTVNRVGLLNSINAGHGTSEYCGSPSMKDMQFQKEGMPAWMAARRGVKDYLHFTGMFDAGFWNDDVAVESWIKEQTAHFVEQNTA